MTRMATWSVIKHYRSKWRPNLDLRCVLLSDPSTFGAGGPNQNTPRIQYNNKINTHLIMLDFPGDGRFHTAPGRAAQHTSTPPCNLPPPCKFVEPWGFMMYIFIKK
jgi:hypothetical protein